MERDRRRSRPIRTRAEAHDVQGLLEMELGGLEPPTSWVRSRHGFRPSLAVLQGLFGARCPLAMWGGFALFAVVSVEIGPTATVFGPVAVTSRRHALVADKAKRRMAERCSGRRPCCAATRRRARCCCFRRETRRRPHTGETNGNRPEHKSLAAGAPSAHRAQSHRRCIARTGVPMVRRPAGPLAHCAQSLGHGVLASRARRSAI
jgi:hypothetical protein